MSDLSLLDEVRRHAALDRASGRQESVLSLLDAGFLYLDRPHAPLQIGAILRVDGADLRDEVEARLAERLCGLPRFMQIPTSVPLSVSHPTWEPAGDFRLADHVFAWAVPRSEGDPVTCRQLHRLLAEPLTPDRPLWDLHLFESAAVGSTALLFRAHHCMLDGSGGIAALELLLDGRAEEPLLTPSAQPGPGPQAWPRFWGGLQRELSRQRLAVVSAARCLRNPGAAASVLSRTWRAARSGHAWVRERVPAHGWNRPLSRDRLLATTSLGLDSIREIRRASDCRFNDVVLTVVAGGVGRYLTRGGASTALPLRVLVPVSRRDAGEAPAGVGNHIAAMRVPVPIEAMQEAFRLRRIQAATRAKISRRTWEDGQAWMDFARALPPVLTASLASRVRLGRFANVVVTNVAGPSEKRFLCGRPIHEIRPIVPLYHDLGLGVAALSYSGRLTLTFHADARLVPDLGRLVADVDVAAAQLRREVLARRRGL